MRLVCWFGCVEGDSFMRTVGKENVIALEKESGCIIICLSSAHCHCDTGGERVGFKTGRYCIDLCFHLIQYF